MASVIGAATIVTELPTIAEEDWEKRWAPYDESIYGSVLDWVKSEDTVLDIGAGDLRLARRLAGKVRHVYAIEVNRALNAMVSQPLSQDNLTVIWGDAYLVPYPAGITVAVLLMRHCRDLKAVVDKLLEVGCRRLITNARWRAGVESIELQGSAIPYASAGMGWYACRCGATGFIPGPAQELTPQIESAVQELSGCPACEKK